MWRRSIRGNRGDVINLSAKLKPMIRKLSAREAARKMANILVEHLETLPAQERHERIQAGQKVIKDLKESTSSSAFPLPSSPT